LENHERRKDQLAKLHQEAQEKVADHQSGRQLFEKEDDYDVYVRRIELYGKKLDKMRKPLEEKVRSK